MTQHDVVRTGHRGPVSAEMTAGPGFRIQTEFVRPAPEVTAGFDGFASADISDLMNRLYTMSHRIRNLTPGLRLLGPACTVKVYPGDNLMVHKSLDVARPGDVIVVDASMSTMTAIIGDLVTQKARHRGIAGFVVDGLIRDHETILKMGDFPVYAQGITPLGPLHRGPGEINYPVSVGGIVVNPGDIVAGDDDGIVIVPRESAVELLDRLRARAAKDADYLRAVAAGEFSNAWVDTILEQNHISLDHG